MAFLALVTASRELDFDRYLNSFDRDLFSGLRADGTVMHSIADLEQTYRPGFEMLESIEELEFRNVKITVLNATTAILVNEYSDVSILKTGGRVSGKGGGTQVWAKSDGAWKLVSVSSSSSAER